MSIVAINAEHPEEIRVASLNKQQISNLYIENTLRKTSLKDIYAGVVRSVEPSLEAVFVEYGPGRHGFLQFKDIASEYFKGKDRQNLKAALKVGQAVMVQVKKEERGTKGAALTTYISLPGTYLVLMPNHPSAGGVSKQIASDSRKDMQHIISQLNPLPNMSVILRTAGAGRPIEDLKKDLVLLLRQWAEIQQAFKTKKPPFLIFQEGDILARTVRDYVREDVTEIVIDDVTVFDKMKDYVAKIRPNLINKLRLYKERIPLFLHLGIEDEVESAFQRAIRLPSGGSVIFDCAEALVAVDINSGSSTKHGDITETALKTNLEAAEMIARQLRLRDLGGLIVIDFIGMKEDAHKKQVENKLWESTVGDRARIQIGHILPRFDVLVMSRQRLRSSLGRANEEVCPACEGRGTQRSIESLVLSIIRAIEKKLFLKKVSQIRVEASVALATYLSNEKRKVIDALERTHQFKLLLLPNPYWTATKYKIISFSSEELEAREALQATASYSLLQEVAQEGNAELSTPEVPAVARFVRRSAHHPSQTKIGWAKKVMDQVMTWLFTTKTEKTQSKGTYQSPNNRTHLPRQMSSSVRARQSTRPVSVASNTRKRVADSPEGVISEKRPVGKAKLLQAIGSEKRPPKQLMRKNTKLVAGKQATLSMAIEEKALNNNPLGSGTPFKPSAVHRYGGKPIVQHRGY
jgi:ribonuclease E